jgi:hypothetical protein
MAIISSTYVKIGLAGDLSSFRPRVLTLMSRGCGSGRIGVAIPAERWLFALRFVGETPPLVAVFFCCFPPDVRCANGLPYPVDVI